jgi:hypothetical protein
MDKLKKSIVIECIASTPDKDVAGETLNIAGADITPLLEQRGYLNSDHRNDFAHTVGKVLDAKKILKVEDCETPTQLKYWQEVKKPFIWAKGELYDGVGHKEADAIASIYKFYMAKGETPPIKVSVEGKTLEREGSNLKRTMIKGLALTLAPCNRKTKSEVTQITKSMGVDARKLFKSEESPLFVEVEDSSIERLSALVNQAKEMISDIRKSESTQTMVQLQSPKLLENLKKLLKRGK